MTARRELFTSVAELYDRARPRYPTELFVDLVALTGIPAGGHVLEMGCGTGQATLPLARLGYSITAVEIGAEMAAVARRKLIGFANVEVVTSAFEEWPVQPEAFDVVLAATAFHWIDPPVRSTKAAAALKPGGSLVLIETHHVAGGDEGFFRDSQDCYRRFMASEGNYRLPLPDEVRSISDDFEASGLFGAATTRRYLWQATYSADEYIDLLGTYSDHLAQDELSREGFLACIQGLIDSRFGGQVRKQYLNELVVAKKSPC